MAHSSRHPDLLRKYWFEFSPTNEALAIWASPARSVTSGVGVTGYDEEDCLRLIEETFGGPLPPVERVLVDVTFEQAAELGAGPNWIAVMAWRGVWFPPRNQGGPVLDS